jgi:hypothetical protein
MITLQNVFLPPSVNSPPRIFQAYPLASFMRNKVYTQPNYGYLYHAAFRIPLTFNTLLEVYTVMNAFGARVSSRLDTEWSSSRLSMIAIHISLSRY